MGLAGVYFGALGHYWYKFLDGKFPGPKRINILKKLLCEMAIGPPFAATAFVFVGRLENKKYQQIWTDLKNNMIFLCIVIVKNVK